MAKGMQARLMVWPVTVLALLGGGLLAHIALPLQRDLQHWLEVDLSWPHSLAQWPPILIGVPMFALFMSGIILVVRVNAIAFNAILNGYL